MSTKTNTLTVRSEMQVALSKIDEQIAGIKAVSESPYKTNGEFKFSPTAHHNSNIHRLSYLPMLITITGFLLEQKERYDKAATVLGLTEYPAFDWLGFPYEAWEHDIKTRVALVTHKEKIDKLTKAKQKLEQFMTEEDRLAIVLKDIQSML